MLEKPDLQEETIVTCLRHEYGLQASQLLFLPLGADVNTAVYRLTSDEGKTYFLKLRKGDFDEISVAVPQFLQMQGIPGIIAPLETKRRKLWSFLDKYRLILFPYIEGSDGYQAALSDRQWFKFGAALKGIHATQIPAPLARRISVENYSSNGRQMVKAFQNQIEEAAFYDPAAAKLAAFMKGQRREINRLVTRAEAYSLALRERPLEFVLCHADMHAGNLLLGADEALYIVDWDNPIFAPKERDLALVGGSTIWHSPRHINLFYQGYAKTEIDLLALAYYRYERIIQDIAAFCQQLFLTSEGGEDREQAYQYFRDQFKPGHEVEIAFQSDPYMVSAKTLLK